MIKFLSATIMTRLKGRFERLYGPAVTPRCLERLSMMAGRYGLGYEIRRTPHAWNQRDAFLITYGDMICKPNEKPLVTLKRFCDEHLRQAFNTIHVLPFFPYSSDDGFSVIYYRTINPSLGTWDHIRNLSEHFKLMFDLVLNHTSRQSAWFTDYTLGIAPARSYFIEVDPTADLSAVVRPRTSPLLSRVHHREGERYLWTTFSEDQLDLNFANPDVLFEFLDLLLFYITNGARAIRMDAIAYLWKEIGTPCIHLPQTHEVVKLFRDVLDLIAPEILLLTETNVPHRENVSYFGKGDEAHMVYQFSLPPLLLHGLLTGQATHLSQWASTLEEAPSGCTFLNFTASHDGIGVRPLQGILPVQEIDSLCELIRRRKGSVSMKQNSDGSESPYEFNISLFDALGFDRPEQHSLQWARFICSQTVPLALKGIPAVYFNSLLATPNDEVGVQQTGRARSINRKKWAEAEITSLLQQPDSDAAKTLKEITRRLAIRAEHPAFHPDGQQSIPSISDAVFAVLRTSPDRSEQILCLHNFRSERIDGGFDRLRSFFPSGRTTDLLSGQTYHSAMPLQLEPYQSVWLV
jgi:glycosidase